MDAFGVLGDPVRRRIVELLATGERSAGDVVSLVGGEFGIGQSAVSQQLKVLREHGFARVRPEGAKRVYALDAVGVNAVDTWLRAVGTFWHDRMTDLAAEIERRPGSDMAAHPRTGAAASARRVAAAAAVTIDAITRPVRDLAASGVFYGDRGIGLRRVPTSSAAGAERMTFDAGAVRLVLVHRATNEHDASTLTIAVPDLERVARRLRSLGVRIVVDAGGTSDACAAERSAQASIVDAEGRPLLLVERIGSLPSSAA